MGAYLYTCTKCGRTFPGKKGEWQEHTKECTGRVSGVFHQAKDVKELEKTTAGKLRPRNKPKAQVKEKPESEEIEKPEKVAEKKIDQAKAELKKSAETAVPHDVSEIEGTGVTEKPKPQRRGRPPVRKPDSEKEG